MIVLISVAVAIIGLVFYLGSTNPKAQEIGRISYFAGLLVFLFQIGPQLVGMAGK